MSRRRGYVLWLLFAFIFGMLCGCAKKNQKEDAQIIVGVTCYDQSDTYVSALLSDLPEALKRCAGEEKETMVIIKGAGKSQRAQNDQAKELLDAGCDVLCVNLVDRWAPSEIIDLARERDVPVIFFNREPVSEDLMQWEKLYYVGADAKESGTMQGELAYDAILAGNVDRNQDGKISYVILEGEVSHQDAIIRTESVVEELNSYDVELEKLSYQAANWNRAQAQTSMTQMIKEYGDRIELVLANNDDMALGAIDAYHALSDTQMPFVFGIDGTDVGLKAVEEKELTGTVYNDKEGQAAAMAQLAVALVNEERVEEKYIYLPYQKVRYQNVTDFLSKQSSIPEVVR